MDQGKNLPPLTLSDISASHLASLIPMLVSMTTDQSKPSYEDETDKPPWWPDDIQWINPKIYVQQKTRKDCLNILRKLVHSCYSYHGVEDLLCRLDQSPEMIQHEIEPSEIEIIHLLDDNEDSQGLDDSPSESDMAVFVCCFCLELYSSHEEVSQHQDVCLERIKSRELDEVPEQRLYCQSASSSCNGSGDASRTRTFDASAVAHQSWTSLNTTAVSISNSGSSSKGHVQIYGPQKSKLPSSAFVPILKTRSQKKRDHIVAKLNSKEMMLKECKEMKDVPAGGAWWTSGCRQKHSSSPIRYSHEAFSVKTFASSLGLMRKKDFLMKKKSESDKKDQEVDLDCQIISVEGPLFSVTPAPRSSASSPRSARSLISQLSRDPDVNSRRRLSFCFVEDEWADKEALEEGRDPLATSLLTIDFSSPLGQRIKKYVKGEGYLGVIRDPENFCKTEVDDNGYSKLRFRSSDYRVTFKKKRRASTHVHQYKFNKQDLINFKRKMRTGLNAKSYYLRKSMPPCKVVLRRLKSSEIKLWTEEAKITIPDQIYYDDDICITQIDIPQSLVKGLSKDYRGEHRLVKPSRSGPYPTHLLHHQRGTGSPLHKSPNPTQHSSSPPHVPNIFRNRSGHAPSPPRKGSYSSHCLLSLSSQNAPLSATQSGAGHVKTPADSGQLSKHAHRPANSQNHQVVDAVDQTAATQKPTNSFNCCGRRKQLLTEIRTEDFDGSPFQNNSSAKAFSPLGNSNRSCRENIHGESNLPSPSDVLPKLSNFDHFSIKSGMIRAEQTSTSCSSPSSSSSTAHHNQNTLKHTAGCSDAPRLSTNPNTHQHLDAIRQDASKTKWPTKKNCTGSHIPRVSQTQSTLDDHKSDWSHSGQGHSRDLCHKFPSLMKQLKPSSGKLSRHSNLKWEEDDVLEVICIDDD